MSVPRVQTQLPGNMSQQQRQYQNNSGYTSSQPSSRAQSRPTAGQYGTPTSAMSSVALQVTLLCFNLITCPLNTIREALILRWVVVIISYVVFVSNFSTPLNTVRVIMVSNLVVNLSGLVLNKTHLVVALFCSQNLKHLSRVLPQYCSPKRL
jgi:hypothetical protein